jgi:hypothetical protein
MPISDVLLDQTQGKKVSIVYPEEEEHAKDYRLSGLQVDGVYMTL